MSDQGGVTPGWYPDPNSPGTQRYWDGNAWTEHTAPIGGGAGAHGAGGAPSFSAGTAGGNTPLPKIDTWLWQSIVVTVLCCLPAGIVGIVFSSQAQSALNVGNVAEAEIRAKQAKTWTLVGAITGAVVIIGYVALMLLGVAASIGGL